MENFKLNKMVKLIIGGVIDPYFGYIREINQDNIVIEHFDSMEIVKISEITDLIY